MANQLKTHNPSYDKNTKVFSQVMSFTSDTKIDGRAIQGVVGHAAKLFKGVIEMNGFDDYVWPPETVEAQPSDDFKGGMVMFATRADKKRPIIIQG